MHIQNFIKIHQLVLKILRKNTFLHQSRAVTCSEDIEEKHVLTSIKGHNSVVYKRI